MSGLLLIEHHDDILFVQPSVRLILIDDKDTTLCPTFRTIRLIQVYDRHILIVVLI